MHPGRACCTQNLARSLHKQGSPCLSPVARCLTACRPILYGWQGNAKIASSRWWRPMHKGHGMLHSKSGQILSKQGAPMWPCCEVLDYMRTAARSRADEAQNLPLRWWGPHAPWRACCAGNLTPWWWFQLQTSSQHLDPLSPPPSGTCIWNTQARGHI